MDLPRRTLRSKLSTNGPRFRPAVQVAPFRYRGRQQNQRQSAGPNPARNGSVGPSGAYADGDSLENAGASASETGNAAIPKHIGLSDMNKSLYALYGSMYIVSIESALYPLDTLKVRLMSNRSTQKQNPLKLVQRIVKNEGVATLWRGLVPSVSGIFPGQALYFGAYEAAHETICHVLPLHSNGDSSFLAGFLSGATAEIVSGLIYVPTDVTSQRLQAQSTNGFVSNKRLYSGPIDVLSRTYASSGILGFYRGYTPYIFSYVPFSSVQWGSYEYLKTVTYKVAANLPATPGVPSLADGTKENIANALSGGGAAVAAIVANQPLEMMRIRSQLLEKGSRADEDLMRRGYRYLAGKIWREEGWRGFYKGMGLRICISVPGTMVAMTGYETVKSFSSQ